MKPHKWAFYTPHDELLINGLELPPHEWRLGRNIPQEAFVYDELYWGQSVDIDLHDEYLDLDEIIADDNIEPKFLPDKLRCLPLARPQMTQNKWLEMVWLEVQKSNWEKKGKRFRRLYDPRMKKPWMKSEKMRMYLIWRLLLWRSFIMEIEV